MQIIVFGMHRSGTSVVARLLNLMGVYFGPEGVEMAAHSANPKGFWERKDVNDACVEALRSAKCGWKRLSKFSLDQIPAPALAEFRERAARIIFGMEAHRPWFIKEPRLCLLARPWLELLESPICLFIHRSPLEIAKSLEARDGLSQEVSLALWERYLTTALNATAGKPRFQVSHRRLMEDPVAVVRSLKERLEALGVVGLRLPSEAEIRAFIDPRLHRAVDRGTEKSPLTGPQKKLLSAFESGSAMRSEKTFGFSRRSQGILLAHDHAAEIEEAAARNLSLSQRLEETQRQVRRVEEQYQRLQAEMEKANQATVLSKKTHEAVRQGVQAIREAAKADAAREAALDALRRKNLGAAAELQRRGAELQVRDVEIARLRESAKQSAARNRNLVEDRDRQLAVERARNEELRRINRVLGKGLDKIETYFQRLRASRSFVFMVYTARRMGLVSRTPRRYVELIKNQFPLIRRAVKEATRPVREVVSEYAAKEATPASPHDEVSDRAVADPTPSEVKSEEENSLGLSPGEEQTNLETDPLVKLGPEPSVRELRVAEANHLRTNSSARNEVSLPGASPVSRGQTTLSFIVLHKEGEQHLRNLFNSFLRFNTLPEVEFHLVLHDCRDGSRAVAESYRNRLEIRITDYATNRSFAYSNNRAAEQSRAEYLVFLNNDIIFQHDVAPELLRLLAEPRNGIAGVRLLFPSSDGEYSEQLQHGGVKFRPDLQFCFHRPWNVGVHIDITETPWVAERFPAVTAALAACRRDDFLKVGGFCEDYFYGYEDVDLCLTFKRHLGLASVSANQVSCIHNESATGRMDPNEAIRSRRLNNIEHLIRRHGWYLRRQWKIDKAAGGLFYSDRPLTVAFAVTDATPETSAGDFFTASELGTACEREFGWNVRFLARHREWYDLKDIDVLVTLFDGYELAKVQDAKPDLLKIAWLRNWFDRWATRPDFESYDIYLCSSERSARWVRTTQRKPAIVFPLATNAQRFGNGEPDTTLASDYCFTGSHWRLPREIETNLQPDRLGDYKFSLFGRGWEGHPTLGDFAHGFVPYEKIPAIYASTRVVIDDANHVTKGWASVNSRVFDALAAGALVVTNGAAGANEFFDGELPVYQTPDELQSLLKNYLGNEVERRRLTDRLRTKVLQQHTYRHRARRLKAILLGRARSCYRIAIKIGAPTRSESRHWGDYHFALSLGRCLAAAGHSYRIDCLDEWERPESFGDDVVLVLRGLSRYQPRCGQINLMWNISHPDKVSLEEYKEFDHVFIASQTHAAELAGKVTVPVSPLLQCSDPFVFYPDPNPAVPYEELLFVGNSRKQYREVVRCAVEANLPLAVYGTFWSRFIGSQYLRGSYVENSILRQYYSRCSILLNDHWPSMRHSGFLSNRLFDAAAAGAFVISDRVQEAESIFGEDLVTYGNSEDFLALIDHYLRHPEERRARAERLREKVLARHTFTHRAEMILSQIRALDSEKRAPERLRNQRSDSSQEKPGLKPLSCRLAPAKATLRLAERE